MKKHNRFDVLEDAEETVTCDKKARKKLREIATLKSKTTPLTTEELEKVSQESYWKSFLPEYFNENVNDKQHHPPSQKKLKQMAEKERLHKMREEKRKLREEQEAREKEKEKKEARDRAKEEKEKKEARYREQQEQRDHKSREAKEQKRQEDRIRNRIRIEFHIEYTKCGSIKSAFRHLSLKYHPDKGGSNNLQIILGEIRDEMLNNPIKIT